MKTFRACHDCEIEHYENCGTCFGFGLRGNVPISANEAHEAHRKHVSIGGAITCPECGSNALGSPQKTRAAMAE